MTSDNELPKLSVFRSPLLLAAAAVAVFSALLFSGTLGHTLLEFDDNVYVYENPLIYPLTLRTVVRIFTTPYFRSYTPVTLLSHAIDYDLWGRAAFGHHLTNVILHGINAASVFLLATVLLRVRRMDPHDRLTDLRVFFAANASAATLAGPVLAALLFALHPMRVESVAWVSDRKDLLLGLFAIPSMGAYVLFTETRGTALGRRLFWLSFCLAVLAMLSKTIATMLPVVFLLVDALPLRHSARRPGRLELLKEKAPFFAASVAVGLMSVLALRGVLRHPVLYHPSALEKLLQPTYALAFYLAKTVWPFNLTPMYTSGAIASLLAALALVVVITVLCVRAATRGKGEWLLAWGTYLLFVVPTVVGKPAAGIQAWADRYSYLPSVPIMIVAGAALAGWMRSPARLPGGIPLRIASSVVTVVLLAGFSVLSVRQIPLWEKDEVLWRHAIAVDREAVMAHTNLAMIMTARGKPDDALAAADSAIALKPTYASAYGAKGLAYDLKGDTLRAIEAYQRAIVLDSNYIDAYSNLANIYLQSDRFDEAIALYETAIARDSTFFSAYYNMGIAWYRRGDARRAMEVFQQTARVNPIYANTYFNMGIILSDWGDEQGAREQYRRAADLGYEPARKILSAGRGSP
jgi:protein O-mannosyl-transferase